MAELHNTQISKQPLGETGNYNMDGMRILINFEEKATARMALSDSNDKMRKKVSEKMSKLTELLTQIYTINESQISNDEKRQEIERLTGNIHKFISNLITEKKSAEQEFKGITIKVVRGVQEDAKNGGESIIKSIQGDIELIIEERKSAQKSLESPDIGENILMGESEEKESEEGPTKENSLVEINTEEKKRLSLFERLRTFLQNIKKSYEDAKKESSSSFDKNQKDERIEIYTKKEDARDRIRRCDEKINAYKKQIKEISEEIRKKAVAVMKSVKAEYDKAVKPVTKEEINPDRVAVTIEKLNKYLGKVDGRVNTVGGEGYEER